MISLIASNLFYTYRNCDSIERLIIANGRIDHRSTRGRCDIVYWKTLDIAGWIGECSGSIEDERVLVECTVNLQVCVIWHYWSYKSKKAPKINFN